MWFDFSSYLPMSTSKSSSLSSISEDETASTSSVSSESASDSSTSTDGGYNNNNTQAKKHNYPSPSNAVASSNDVYDEEQEVVHIPPKTAFQIFELIELKRRCKDLYRRHQEKRRQSVIKANNSLYHSFTSGFESYCIDGRYLYDWASDEVGANRGGKTPKLNTSNIKILHLFFFRRSKYDKCFGSTAAPSYSYSIPFKIILHCLSISYRSNVVKSGIVKNVNMAAA